MILIVLILMKGLPNVYSKRAKVSGAYKSQGTYAPLSYLIIYFPHVLMIIVSKIEEQSIIFFYG